MSTTNNNNNKKLQNTSLPLVQFEYPDSTTNHMKIRFVRVVELNGTFLTGFELTPTSLVEEKFKRFNLKRMAKNSISLRRYIHISAPK